MNIFELQHELNRQNILLHGQSMHDYLSDRHEIKVREALEEKRRIQDIRERIERLERYLNAKCENFERRTDDL